MNDQNTTTPYPGLIVIGASGAIGREVARLGVAFGAEVVGVTLDGLPPNNDPWIHGVTWLSADATLPGVLDDLRTAPIVVAAPIDLPDGIPARFERVVFVARGETSVQATSRVTVATPGEVDDTPIDAEVGVQDLSKLRVETVGMALLRAALDDLPKELGPDEIAHYGDSVMLQGTL